MAPKNAPSSRGETRLSKSTGIASVLIERAPSCFTAYSPARRAHSSSPMRSAQWVAICQCDDDFISPAFSAMTLVLFEYCVDGETTEKPFDKSWTDISL